MVRFSPPVARLVTLALNLRMHQHGAPPQPAATGGVPVAPQGWSGSPLGGGGAAAPPFGVARAAGGYRVSQLAAVKDVEPGNAEDSSEKTEAFESDLQRRMANYLNTDELYDLVVLGGGPAGVRAAVEASGRGQRVALIEPKPAVTGAPTGAHSKCLREAAQQGAKTWDEVMAITGEVVKAAVSATSRQLRTFMVEVHQGSGRLLDEGSIELAPADGSPAKVLRFDSCVIATGSRSNRVPPADYDLPGVFDSDTIWNIGRLPRNVIVQGAGIIGMEYGLIFKKLGAETVTIVDINDEVAPFLDSSLQEAIQSHLIGQGVEFVMETQLTAVEALEGSTEEAPKLRVTLEGGRVLEGDMLLSAPGRAGATDDIGLERLEGVKVSPRGFIEADENGYTGVGKIYAVGDCAGGALATIGQAQAVRAMRALYGSGMVEKEKGLAAKPYGIWTIPEVAYAGVTEEEARANAAMLGGKVGTVKVDFAKTVRGCVTREEGFLKLVYDAEDGRVLGVHMSGENSADLINFGAEAISDGDTIYDVLQFVFPAVTYHELYYLAAWEAKQRMMHKGARSLQAAVSWQRLGRALQRYCEEEGKPIEDVLIEAFLLVDTDYSGFIRQDQLKESLATLGIELEDSEVKKMVVEATGSPDGELIEYKEFLRIFMPEPEVKQELIECNLEEGCGL